MGRTNIWIILLLVSVLLNGVLLGFGARTWFGPEQTPAVSQQDGARGFNMRAFIAALPEEHRLEARELMRAERQALRQQFRNIGRARAEARAIMNADVFDPEAAAQALERVREAEALIQARSEVVIFQIVDRLTPEERRAVLRQSMRAPRGGPPRRGPRGEGPLGEPSPERGSPERAEPG